MTRFLVLGAAGMAGHTISIYLQEQGNIVTGFARRDLPFVSTIVGDVRDSSTLESTIRQGDYDVVINAIGLLNMDAEEHEEDARYLNGVLPHYLASLVEGTPARVFHMSTDCVFAGNTGPYTEDSTPDGETVYDRTKAAGELRDGHNLTFRCSIIGPDLNPDGIGLLNWFMGRNGKINGYTHAMWTGLTTLELAKAMERAAAEGVAGLVNMVPEVNISKFELLELLNERLRGGDVEIVPADEPAIDKTLLRTNFESAFRPKSYAEQVHELAEWILDHGALYPHYERRMH